jgi:hypothetical protein
MTVSKREGTFGFACRLPMGKKSRSAPVDGSSYAVALGMDSAAYLSPNGRNLLVFCDGDDELARNCITFAANELEKHPNIREVSVGTKALGFWEWKALFGEHWEAPTLGLGRIEDQLEELRKQQPARKVTVKLDLELATGFGRNDDPSAWSLLENQETGEITIFVQTQEQFDRATELVRGSQ